MTSPPLIDRAVIDDLFDNIDAVAVRSVLSLFIEESQAYLARIAEASAQPDDAARREQARRAAHSLKSGAGQIGTAALAAAAAEVERVAATGSSDLAPAAASLHQCAVDTVKALEPFLSARA